MKTSAAASRISRREASGSRAADRCGLLSLRVLLTLTAPEVSGRAPSCLLFDLAADRPTEHEALDLGRPFIDLQDPLVAVEPLDLGWLAVAVAGPDLHR